MSKHLFEITHCCCSIYSEGKSSKHFGLAQHSVHKDRFYHCGRARYLDACPGSFHLLPRAEHLTALLKDYRAMKVIFFYSVPEFDSILEKLANLESELNSK